MTNITALSQKLSSNSRKTMDAIKICVVCGDRANGYNFNVIACESCKAFFRRNALRKKEFKCPFSGNCKIDSITRKFCQKCRLQKCFDSGMKKDLILTDEEKRIIKFKIAENKQKRVKLSDSNSVDSTITSTTITTTATNPLAMSISSTFNGINTDTGVHPLNIVYPINHHYLSQILMNNTNNREHILGDSQHFMNNFRQNNCDNTVISQLSYPIKSHLANNEENSNGSSNSNHSRPSVIKYMPNETKPKPNMNVEELEFFNKFFCLNKLEEIFRSEIENDLSNGIGSDNSRSGSPTQMTGDDKPPKHSICNLIPVYRSDSDRVLNDLERNRMNELSDAFADIKDPDVIQTENNQHLDAVKLTDKAVQQLIKMIRKINGYKNLCQHDQLALMKAGCTELIILRSVQNYNFEREFWSFPFMSARDDIKNIQLDGMRQPKRPTIYEAHKRFMRLIGHEWDTDLDILNLLSTIVLFDPKRPDIIHKDMIAFEHQINKYLLQRYLEIKCGTKSAAKEKYLRLMDTLEELHTLNEENVRYHLEVDPREIGPLLIELFNLKP
ncbi:nuclear hormone receptor HR96-like [Oppia nitens]|uniref:nuclear hormone receptor HR96-like n=1 Tax=Oppia nitens TaxID=1686743 RepID=UPI0023DB8AB4|nr:nuclear hormone receptor HR96-like [Oppia nitens]XP_054163641.1 nuclear hormone receptor HR96-like [Oppia nitens]XP_054163642.1 nuclear hormone receptor HR96-like [Oppia nitens]